MPDKFKWNVPQQPTQAQQPAPEEKPAPIQPPAPEVQPPAPEVQPQQARPYFEQPSRPEPFQPEPPYQGQPTRQIRTRRPKRSGAPMAVIIAVAVTLICLIAGAVWYFVSVSGNVKQAQIDGYTDYEEEPMEESYNPAGESSDASAPAEAYADSPRRASLERALNTLFLASTARYFLYDFDNDGTAEMIIDAKGEGYSSQLKVFQFVGDDVVRFGSIDNPACLFRLSEGKLYMLEPYGEGYTTDLITLNGRSFDKSRIYTPVDRMTAPEANPFYSSPEVEWYPVENLNPALALR